MTRSKTKLDGTSPPTVRSIAGSVIVGGFGTAIAMWLTWLIGHQPWLDLPAAATGIAMLGWLVAGACFGGLHGGRRLGWLAGGGTTLVAAMLNLLIMGSLVSESIDGALPAEGSAGLTPSARMTMLGFLGASFVGGAVIGGASGLIARAREPRPLATWAGRFAVVAAIAVAPLLLLGGLVTSTGSGLAVPDWPGTYGANMFLYPIALMADPRIFLEHTHRLFGSLVGITTISLAIFVWSTRELRKKMDVPIAIGVVVAIGAVLVAGLRMHTSDALGGLAFGGIAVAVALGSVAWFLTALGKQRPAQAAAALILMVSAQGVLGGTRVTEANPLLGTIHGVLGQAYFASMVMFAAWVSPTARNLRALERPRAWVRSGAWMLLAALLLQLVMGAMYRHGSMAAEPRAWAGPALHGHMTFSVIVVILASIVGFALIGQGSGPSSESGDGHDQRGARASGRLGKLLFVAVLLQFALGWVAFALVTGGEQRVVPTAEQLADATSVPVATALVTFAHQANGALLLATASAAVVWGGLVLAARRQPRVQPAAV
ncbi:MAG: COX15/CtaA family protein [Phycisphaera sp.]|nr:MAG: COX15/CtaA family protein [Phycisphaera sp.]